MMNYNVDVILVWSGAAMEAKTFGQDEIEPYHFLCYALKFAEIDSSVIGQIAKGSEEEQIIKASHAKLRAYFEHYSIKVPETSTQFRRALRRKGDSINDKDERMLHRSSDLREVFDDASKIVTSEGRNLVDVCDLVNIIFEKKYDWICSNLKKLGITLDTSNEDIEREHSEKYDGILFHLKEDSYLDDEEKERIESDPIVKTFFTYLSQPNLQSHRPCLLIKTGTRYGEDIIKDTIKFSFMNKASVVKIGAVHCNALLEKITSNNLYDISVLEEIADTNKQLEVLFFDSVHRYLSKPIVGESFPILFKQWLKDSDGRFIFETTEEQYTLNFEKQEWKGVFHIIWIHELNEGNDYNL